MLPTFEKVTVLKFWTTFPVNQLYRTPAASVA